MSFLFRSLLSALVVFFNIKYFFKLLLDQTMSGFDPAFLAKYSKEKYEDIMQASIECSQNEAGGILAAPTGPAVSFGVGPMSGAPTFSFGVQPSTPTFGVSPSFGVTAATAFGFAAAPTFGVAQPPGASLKRKRNDGEGRINEDGDSSSKVLTNGSNMAGQLGFKTAEEEEDDVENGDYCDEKEFPSIIEGLDNVVRVAAGGMHNLVLNSSGKVFIMNKQNPTLHPLS
jgi:hypothetical protein